MQSEGNMSNLQQTIYETKAFHEKCLELSHGVLKRNGEWMNFWPTHFIFAFIAFNNVYNINWQESIRRGRVCKKAFPCTSNNPTESDKMNALIDFCCTVLGNNSAYNYYKSRLCASLSFIENPVAEIHNVYIDSRTRNNYPEFVKVLNKVYYDAILIDDIKPEYMKKLVLFVYKVRCNTFHGSKAIDQLVDESQQQRFRIYTAIVLSLNELFFHTVNEMGAFN